MTRFLDKAEAAFNLLIGFFFACTALTIGFFALSIPLNLLLLKLEWNSIWWLNEAIEYILYAGVFLSAPWVLQQGSHVRVDLLATQLPPKLAVKLEHCVDVIGATLCAALFYYGVRAAVGEFEDGTLPDKNFSIANWYMMAIFAASFFMLMIEFMFRLRRASNSILKENANPNKAAF